MQWEAIGAVGDIAGAAAVVISLVYLARQMTISNRLAKAEAFREGSGSLISLIFDRPCLAPRNGSYPV